MKKSFKTLCSIGFITVLMLVANSLFAQTATIAGTVKDANGAVSGASISIKGSTLGTTTNAAGQYELKVKPGKYTLLISYVGYSPYSVVVEAMANQTTNGSATIVSSTNSDEIVVVGSRTGGRSKLSTPVPVDVISAKELKSFAQVDASQILSYQAPSFQSARQTVSDGTDHIDPAGLRGLGPDQTLVLLNGKRRHNTALVNINGTVGRGSVGTDLNAIPVAAIERIEILRDGAAAQYGSDAIAGVINVVLKKNFTGLNVSATTGQNYTKLPYGGNGINIQDGLTNQVDLYGGFKLGNKGGHVVVSGQYLNRGATNRSGNDNIPLLYYGNAGAFPTAPAGENAVDYRRYLINLDKNFAAQRGYDRHNIVAGNSASENVGGFVNGSIPLSTKTELYFTAGAGDRKGSANGFSRNPNSAAQQPVTANGVRYYFDGFLPQINTSIKDFSTIVGVKTKLGTWDFDISNTNGENKIFYTIKNSGNASLPATNNVQTQFEAGGLKFMQNTTNVDFSHNFKTNGSSSGIDLALGAEYRYEKFDIVAGELNSYVNGGRQAGIDPIPSYNGTNPVTFANTPAGAGAQVFPGFSPNDALSKNRNVIGVYADAEATFGKFLIGAATRYEKYSDFGSGFGGKISARVEATKMFSFRASANAGFRAPSLHQRYFQNTSTQFVGGLPSQSLTANNDNPIVRNNFGIQALKPEKSTSITAGVVAKITPALTVTVDGYLINIKDRIVLSSAFSKSGNPLVAPILAAFPDINVLQFWTNAVDTRTTGVDVVANYRFKIGKANATFSVAGNFNENEVVGDLKTNSIIDAAANNPSLTDATKNPALDFKNALFDRQQRSRIEVAQPKYKVNYTFNYQLNKVEFTFRTVVFGNTQFINNLDPNAKRPDGTLFNDILPQVDQTFKKKFIHDLIINYKPTRFITLTLGVNNLADTYPDRIFIDPRNEAQNVFNNPINGANTAPGGYSAGRDASNRGRFLFNANQFGFNGRYVYSKINIDFGLLSKKK